MKRHRLLTILAGSACAAALAGGAHAQSFVNGSFENGTTSGWTTGGGYWSGGAYPLPSDYLPGGSQYVSGAGSVSITNAGFDPLTDGVLRQAYAGAHSAMVNDPYQDTSVAVLSQVVTNYADPLIAFAYAAVLESSHGPTDSDAFIIELRDLTTSEVLFTYNLNSATAPGVFTQSTAGWFYTDWIEQSVDVSARIGHDFQLSLLANDCPYGGHAGYAYLDGFGSVEGGGGTGGGATVIRLYWDGEAAGNPNNNIVDGGAGIWNAVNSNWTESNGSTNGAYSPNPGTVVFSGSPGVVTVNKSQGDISVTGMQFTTGGYRIQGDNIILSGTDATIQVGNGAPEGAAFTVTIASPLTQAQNATTGLTKTDLGKLILVGASTYTGPTTITGGTLQVDGSLAASGVVTAQSATTLSGNGSVGSVVAETGSTVAPGASIGTLTVNGSYAQAAGSTYQVEVTSAGANDALLIGGAASLSTGAQLHLTKLDAPRYVLNQRYTVLTATGGLTGRYLLSGDTHVSAFFDVVDHYDPTHVYLDVSQTSRFAAAGETPNQIAAADGADSGSGPLFEAIAYLQTYDEAKAAFDQISGEAHASAKGAGIEDSRFIREAVFDRLRREPTSEGMERAVWGRVFGSRGNIDSDGNAANTDRDIGGLLMGVDVAGGENWRGGVTGGFSRTNLTVHDRHSSVDTNAVYVGGYAGTQRGPWGVRLGGTYAARQSHSQREVAFTGLTDSLTAHYEDNIGQLFGEVGHKAPMGQGTVEPYASLAHVNIQTSGFHERGGAAALTGRSDDQSVTFTTLGVRATGSASLNGGTMVNLHGGIGWRHATGDIDPTSTFAFQSGGPLFTVAGVPIAKDAAALEAGVDAAIGERGNFSLTYSGQVGSGLSDHGVKATMLWKF